MKKKQKITIAVVAAVALIGVLVALIVLLTTGKGNSYEDHLKLAEQYIEELQYEQAIAELRAAIDIEPERPEGYDRLADVYLAMGDTDSAIAVLEEGYQATGNEEMQKKLETLRNTDEQTEIETTPETTEEKELTVSVSEQGYEFLAAAGKNYFVKENDLYGVIDAEGKVIIPCEYSYILSALYDDCFALMAETDTGYECVLYDADGNEIFRNTNYPEYYMKSYNEGILQLMKVVDTGMAEGAGWSSEVGEYVYLDSGNGFTEIYNSETSDKWGDYRIETTDSGHVLAYAQDWLSPYSHGYITTRQIFHTAAENSAQARMGDTNGNFSWMMSEISGSNYDGLDIEECNSSFRNIDWNPGDAGDFGDVGMSAISFDSNSSIGTDGWVLGMFFAVDYDSYDIKINYKWGLYNIDTKQIAFIHPSDVTSDTMSDYVCSEEGQNFSWKWADSNLRTVTVNNMMLIDFENDGTYSVWNVAEDRYMTSDQYSYVDLTAYKTAPILACKDDKWGYLDDNFEVLSWFDDASDFSGDYALVVKDGGVYVIDRELNIISDKLEGTGVTMMNDSGSFRIKRDDGKYYICTVELK